MKTMTKIKEETGGCQRRRERDRQIETHKRSRERKRVREQHKPKNFVMKITSETKDSNYIRFVYII